MLFYEPKLLKLARIMTFESLFHCFSALLRAEIVEIAYVGLHRSNVPAVSVLFYEPKLLKQAIALDRAHGSAFQCSSTSRNC